MIAAGEASGNVALADAGDIPASIGFVGVGTLSCAVVRGLMAAAAAKSSAPPRIVLSPRNAEKVAKLASEYKATGVVRVAASNQEVVDTSDCIIVAVLPKQAEAVLAQLKFRETQQVLSLVASIGLERVRELAVPASDCAIAVPLPAVARRQGVTLVYQSASRFAEAIFRPLGTCVSVDDQAQYRRLQSITGLMGDFYKRQLTAQRWLEKHGVPPDSAAAYVGGIFSTMAADSAAPSANTLNDLVAEQTPGGINEMVWKGQEEDGSYSSLVHGLDAAHHRFATGISKDELAPAKKRAKVSAET
eukprot:TRINITY_DN71384_c0_g1_i1.p1 TRINITY_DN71384_c0_g1~~TRINITY_DN71384_c0_g1_i1.p1  ORF type:complete len:331 (-),score=63.61 TRINITY_DN71384_c0_g1_i1:11-919(-)